jgi:transcription antitermination factor NusG
MSAAYQITPEVVDSFRAANPTAEDRVERWYAAYTNPRHEKSVALQMRKRQIDCFLPLYRSVRRWKDRRKELALPLFPGYVFVRMPLLERLRVLGLPGVVRLVTFQGKPAPLPDCEVEALQHGLQKDVWVRPHPYLKTGRRVRVQNGPLSGVEGILVRRKEKLRLVISIDLLMRSMAVEVDEADVEPLP